jgi:hypothetical protein
LLLLLPLPLLFSHWQRAIEWLILHEMQKHSLFARRRAG